MREMCGCLFVYRQGFAVYTRLFLNLLCNPGWVQICSDPPNFRAFCVPTQIYLLRKLKKSLILASK